MRNSLALALAVLSAAPALAEPATPEGAARIDAALRSILGQTEGVVTVAPEGETYALTIDLAPLMAMIPSPGLTFEATPTDLTLTDLGGGKWQVEAPEGPWSMALTVPGAAELSISFETFVWSGVWDEALMAFASTEGRATKMSMTQLMTVPGEPAQDVAYTVAEGVFSSSAAPSAGGGVDGQSRYELSGLYQEIAMPAPDGSGTFDVVLDIDSYVTDGTYSGLRTGEILGLVAWFVANNAPEAMMADEAGLKAVVRAALPLWNSINAIATAEGISVETPFGSGAADSFVVAADLNGAVSDGRFRERLAVTGLQLPTEIMPPWVVPLLPRDVTLDFAVTGFDASAPALMALDTLTFAAPPAPDFGQMLAMAAMPNGNVTISLAETGLQGEGFGLTLDGAMLVGPMSMPSGTATAVMTGVDTIIGHLNGAPDDVKGGAIPALGMARGLARAEGDRLVWDLEMTPDGQMLVNGNDLSGMFQ